MRTLLACLDANLVTSTEERQVEGRGRKEMKEWEVVELNGVEWRARGDGMGWDGMWWHGMVLVGFVYTSTILIVLVAPATPT